MITSSQRLPVTTYLGHTDRALDFYLSESVYFGLGRSKKWDDEDNKEFVPPEPDMAATTLDQLACLKKVSQKQMVMPADSGDIEFDGQYWKILTTEEAKKQQSRWVYLTASLKYTEVNLTEYRQIGVFNRVAPKNGVVSDLLLPDDIADVGLLIALNNRYRVTRQTDTKDVFSLIIEF